MTKKPTKKHIAAIIIVTIAVIILGGIFLKLYVFTPLNKAVWKGENKMKEYGLTGTVTLSEERELRYIHFGASWPWDIYFVTCDIDDLDSQRYETVYNFVKSTQMYGEKDGDYQISIIITSGGKNYRVTDGSLYIDGEKAYDYYMNHGIGRVPTTKETTKDTEETTSIIVPPQPSGPLPTYDDDPFYINDYDDPDDFYYWNYDDFYDYEDAEEYFYSHHK